MVSGYWMIREADHLQVSHTASIWKMRCFAAAVRQRRARSEDAVEVGEGGHWRLWRRTWLGGCSFELAEATRGLDGRDTRCGCEAAKSDNVLRVSRLGAFDHFETEGGKDAGLRGSKLMS